MTKKTRVRLLIKGEKRLWVLSEGQVWLLSCVERWNMDKAIEDCGIRAVQMLNGLVKTGLMRKIGQKTWERTALGGKVVNEMGKN